MRQDLKKMTLLLMLAAWYSFLLASSKPAKQAITLEDLKTWRDSSVTLSDDGQWYTVLYTLTEKPISPTPPKTQEKKKEPKNQNPKLYGETEQTDVLYIHNASSSQMLAIKDGSKPQFSPCSEWIAYSIKAKEEKVDGKDAVNTIELRHLPSGKTHQWNSNAAYRFSQNEPYFISFDKSDLLLFNLKTEKEHYISNIGEFVLNKSSHFLLYSITSPDKRGNGIYLYDLQSRVTICLDSESCLYANLAWNWDQSALSAVKFQKNKEGEPIEIRLLTCQRVQSATPSSANF